jgi:hypothetical protein
MRCAALRPRSLFGSWRPDWLVQLTQELSSSTTITISRVSGAIRELNDMAQQYSNYSSSETGVIKESDETIKCIMDGARDDLNERFEA